MSTITADRPLAGAGAGTLAAPKLTATHIAAALRSRDAVVVWDLAAGSTYPLPQGMTAAQADDPDLVVVLTYREAADYVAEAGGREGAAAKAATLDLAAAHLRGLL